MLESDKANLRNVISSAQRLGIDSMDDFETLISKCMKYRALKIFHDNDHLINSVNNPSGQLQAQGTDSFYRYGKDHK